MQKVVCLSQWWPQLLRKHATQFCSLKFARLRKWKGKVNLNFLLDQGQREKQHFSPVRDKMSLSKVMPSSAESKSGKIFANSEQKETLMAVYLTDNYPDTSTLEQVAISIRVRLEKRHFARLFQKLYFLLQVSNELGFSLDWVRQWFMYTRWE